MCNSISCSITPHLQTHGGGDTLEQAKKQEDIEEKTKVTWTETDKKKDRTTVPIAPVEEFLVMKMVAATFFALLCALFGSLCPLYEQYLMLYEALE